MRWQCYSSECVTEDMIKKKEVLSCKYGIVQYAFISLINIFPPNHDLLVVKLENKKHTRVIPFTSPGINTSGIPAESLNYLSEKLILRHFDLQFVL